MKEVQNQCDLSNKTVIDMAATFRGQGVEIEPGLREELYESGKILSEHFEVRKIDMEVKEGDEIVTKPKDVVLCKNVDKFVDHVKKERNIQNASLKFGADGGGT